MSYSFRQSKRSRDYQEKYDKLTLFMSNKFSDFKQEVILPKELLHTVISITKNLLLEISETSHEVWPKKEDKEIQDTRSTLTLNNKVLIKVRRKWKSIVISKFYHQKRKFFFSFLLRICIKSRLQFDCWFIFKCHKNWIYHSFPNSQRWLWRIQCQNEKLKKWFQINPQKHPIFYWTTRQNFSFLGAK